MTMPPRNDAAPRGGGAGVNGPNACPDCNTDQPRLTPPARWNAPAGTSGEAARRIAGGTGELRRRVLDYIRSCGPDGATDAETQAALGMLTQTQTPRRRELVLLRLVVDSRRRRLTPRGRPAAVWIVTVTDRREGPGGRK